MQHHSDSYQTPLSSLLSILNRNKPGSSTDTPETIDLLSKLLLCGDYVNVAGQLSQDLDAKNLLDFILHILRNDCLSRQGAAVDISRRARRFMFKVISKIPIIPTSLIVTGVIMPTERDYVGGGGFGRVFKGELEGEVVALKVLYKSDNQVAFCREALMWRSLKHKFVLPFLGIHELDEGTAPQFFLISPYMKNGTIAQWRKRAHPSANEVEERILEVALGIGYIHSEGAVHGDIRGENILLDDNFHVQISDFGLTRLSEATNTQSGAKHANFAAPELFGCLDDPDDSAADDPLRTQMSDVYAFGCFYYEIHFDSIPFSGRTEMQIMGLVARGTHPARLDEPLLSDGAWEVIQHCWAREPAGRPRMKEVAESMATMFQSGYTVSPEVPSGALSSIGNRKISELGCVAFRPQGGISFPAWGPSIRPEKSAPQPSIKHRRGKRTEEERKEHLEADPYIAELEPHRVLCVSCDKWIRLRSKIKYFSAPWVVHRKSCTAKEVRKNGSWTTKLGALSPKDWDAVRSNGKRVLCGVCDTWLHLNADNYLQAAQKWADHKRVCSDSTESARSAPF